MYPVLQLRDAHDTGGENNIGFIVIKLFLKASSLMKEDLKVQLFLPR